MDEAWVDEGAPERAVRSGMTLAVVWMAGAECNLVPGQWSLGAGCVGCLTLIVAVGRYSAAAY